MRAVTPLFLFPALIAAAPTTEEGVWASVPARGAHPIGAVAVAGGISPDAIRLVGTAPHEDPPAVRRPVFAVEIAGASARDDSVQSRTADDTLPTGVLWPDAKGRITCAVSGANSKGPAIETVYECGGIMMAGSEGSVAIINRRLARHGDILGDFRVAGIFPRAAVLERNKILFALPLGRSTSIVSTGP